MLVPSGYQIAERAEAERALVACAGNELVGDDAVGWAVYEQLARGAPRAGTRVAYIGLLGLGLMDELVGQELLVVVDAVVLGAPVGTVHVLPWDQLPAAPGRAVSGHGIGLRETLEIARRLYPEKVPGRVMLVGVEGACFDQMGVPLSPGVADAVPQAAARVWDLVAASRTMTGTSGG